MTEDKPDQPVEDDRYLIARFRAGEVEAFDRLMDLHMDRVYRVAWQALHDHEESLDATQEVFIRLHGALPRLGEVNSLAAWLYRVCVNHCIDRKRRPGRETRTLSEEEWETLRGPEHSEPEWSTEQAELGVVIRSAVGELPKQQRAAFILRHYEHLSLVEIAEALGCCEGTVKCHLSRATSALRDKLRERGIPIVTDGGK
ncbi:MAG: RNA polymerase sigma factor [Armatimonadota bacterium]|nr:RNA polymerase sigma factor [Armatimonadota bacterium]